MAFEWGGTVARPVAGKPASSCADVDEATVPAGTGVFRIGGSESGTSHRSSGESAYPGASLIVRGFALPVTTAGRQRPAASPEPGMWSQVQSYWAASSRSPGPTTSYVACLMAAAPSGHG